MSDWDMEWDMLLVTLSFDFLVVVDNGCLATEGVIALDRVRWRLIHHRNILGSNNREELRVLVYIYHIVYYVLFATLLLLLLRRRGRRSCRRGR